MFYSDNYTTIAISSIFFLVRDEDYVAGSSETSGHHHKHLHLCIW